MNKSRIDYILFHLDMIIDLNDIRPFFFIDKEFDPEITGIYFPLSDKKLDTDSVLWIENIPVLYPLSDTKQFYRMEANSVIFEHDLLQSAFYLLSCRQELDKEITYPRNKYSYNDSIHKKLGIVEKPIVNYYFQFIIKAIETFCRIHNIPLKKRRLFPQPILFMTHDVDRVHCYNFARFKLFLKKFKLFKAIQIPFINLFNLKNPWWNFDYFLKTGKKYDVRSTWFFLDKGIKHTDAYYSFSDPEIRSIIRKLEKTDHEIGLHGTLESAYKKETFVENLRNLQAVSSNKILGVRQHSLNHFPELTSIIHYESGMEYDSTLGFYDHAGFRNSWCYPFKPYSFKREEIINIWEFPLTAMDVSLSNYQKLDLLQSADEIKLLIDEVRKFNGIFTLLIHNNFIGEMNKKERRNREFFYQQLLDEYDKSSFLSLTGREILDFLKK